MTTQLRVLVVEDDAVLREMLGLHLRGDGMHVRETGDGDAVLGMVEAEPVDVVVLDVMLPGRSGIDVCVALRERSLERPGVLMVTARGEEADVVLGLDSGADDYVVKPVRPREIVARVRALARRLRLGEPGSSEGERSIVVDTLEVNPSARRVFVSGVEVPLTTKEFELAWLFASRPDHAFPRAEILERVWETTHAGYARNVDCHVMRLRRKLERAGFPAERIETVHGTGYRFRR